MDSGFYLQLPDSPERSEKLWVLKEKYGAIWWKLFDKILSLHYKGTSPRDNVKYFGQNNQTKHKVHTLQQMNSKGV